MSREKGTKWGAKSSVLKDWVCGGTHKLGDDRILGKMVY
jgi:hypothetical protein